MAPLFSAIFPRVDAPPVRSTGLSSTATAGLAVVSIAAVSLAVLLAVMCLRRRKKHEQGDNEKTPRTLHVQPSIEKEPLPADLLGIAPARGGNLARSVSRRNLTPSIILPAPVPPIPAARPRPPKTGPAQTSARVLSAAEVVAHHVATGTTPRAFSPVPAAPAAPAPFSFALRASVDRSSHARSRSGSSSVRFSRSSILGASASSLRASFSSGSTISPGAEMLKVRHVFTPLLPDELVLRAHEKVSLVQRFDDGWCVVGRKSPFAAPARFTNGASNYPFGQGRSADEVEIGAVPAWVFDKHAGSRERPMRSASLGVTLVLDDNEQPGREDVISWSNF